MISKSNNNFYHDSTSAFFNVFSEKDPHLNVGGDVKSFKISNELDQNLSGLQIFLNFAQNSESQCHTQRSRKIAGN